jgi:hypothetical protein
MVLGALPPEPVAPASQGWTVCLGPRPGHCRQAMDRIRALITERLIEAPRTRARLPHELLTESAPYSHDRKDSSGSTRNDDVLLERQGQAHLSSRCNQRPWIGHPPELVY